MTGRRLVSLDVFRGLAIAGMIVVNTPGGETVYSQLEHSAWNGLTFADAVFPAFLFAMGASLVLSLTARREAGASRGEIAARVLRRAAIIFALGILYNGFPYAAHVRVMGVLQRIALCFLFGALLFLADSPAAEAGGAAALLGGYWLLMTRVPHAAGAPGDLSPGGNLASQLDRLVLGVHIFRPSYDPEGLLSTLPAVATALCGVLAGRLLLRRVAPGSKAAALGGGGVALILAGLVWSAWFPLNKALWTSSFALTTAGLSACAFAACYWLIEIRGASSWSAPFRILGSNALAAYLMADVLYQAARRITVAAPGGGREQLRYRLCEVLFGRLGPANASLAYALAACALCLAAAWALNRRKLFLRI